MTIANIFELLGGLGFFLFGMSLLGDGLKRVAGGKLETVLAKLTSNTFKGVLLGTIVTAIIQSSSATTVMVVGFVNSGIMQLVNAIGIIMGANIGTTATGWILVLAGVEGSGPISSATIFALEDGKEVGFVLFFHNFSTFLGRAGIYIEDLFVKPEFRKRGHGKGLIKEVARICVERNCGRLEFCCLDWNKPSIDFYLSLGATPLNDWTTYRFEGQSLSNLLKK